jgi:hypothetical protein
MIRDGRMTDAQSIAAWALLSLHERDDFCDQPGSVPL